MTQPTRVVYWSAILLGLLLSSPVRANDDLPPVVGQPAHFSGAVGTSFQVSLRASPDQMRFGEPFTLTLRVVANGPWRRPPQRLNLDDVEGFSEHFRIDRGQSDRPDRELPTPRPHWTIDRRLRPHRPIHIIDVPAEQRTWEFDYQLRPISEGVDEVPAVPFAYYRPPRDPALPGSFPTTFAEPIAIKVLPKEVAKLPAVTLEAPASFLRIATGPAVTRDAGVFRAPALPWLIGLLLLPPLAGVGWYVAWQRLLPDAARLARRRQSRAARQALHELRQVKGTSLERARRASGILADYLRHRFGLSGLEPTPAEVGQFLLKLGVAPELAERATQWFQTCDAIRFAPESSDVELTATARELILELENGEGS
jgi:hypothetical protein